MDIKSSQLIEKIVKMEGKAFALTGYILHEGSATKAKKFRLYPNLEADLYYEIDSSSVLEIVESSKDSERRTVFLSEGAEFYTVQRKRHSASDLQDFQDLTPLRGKLPPWMDRLTLYLLLKSSGLLDAYLGTELIPGTGQSGKPGDNL